jgi:CubicO group peptidase (beta-lactamase class C family)
LKSPDIEPRRPDAGGLHDCRRVAIGIHGQWLYVDPLRETVIAKFSSQPQPTNDEVKMLNLGLFEAIAAMA